MSVWRGSTSNDRNKRPWTGAETPGAGSIDPLPSWSSAPRDFPLVTLSAEAKIYHITHVDNLVPIAAAGALVCDRKILESGGPIRMIGMSEIKRRRIEELEVRPHTGTKVGDYVPFYFCPRSIMLYVIYMANHPALTYRGGQKPIVHLEVDLGRIIRWADENGVPWAFCLSNAGARYAEFRARVEDLDELDWTAIGATDFRDPDVKEAKQAEFLVHEQLPFELVERIGVYSDEIRERTIVALRALPHQATVEVVRDWYY